VGAYLSDEKCKVRVLMIGDVVGKPGGGAVRALVPGLRSELRLDLVIANGENAAGGAGLTQRTADGLPFSGVDVITSGNHIWDQKEIIPHLDGDAPILRQGHPDRAGGPGGRERAMTRAGYYRRMSRR
jgi:calcineurin-like phosphoesterase